MSSQSHYDRETGGRNPFAREVNESFVAAVRHTGFTPLATPKRLREDYTGHDTHTAKAEDANGNGAPDAQEALNASAEKFVKSAMALKFGQSEVLEAVKLAFSNAIRSSTAAPVKESYDQLAGSVFGTSRGSAKARSYDDLLQIAIPGAVSVPLNERRPDARGSLAEAKTPAPRKPAKSAAGNRVSLVEAVSFTG